MARKAFPDNSSPTRKYQVANRRRPRRLALALEELEPRNLLSATTILIAHDDVIDTDAGNAVAIPVEDNDTSSGSLIIVNSVAVATPPSHGQAAANNPVEGQVLYTPAPGFFGTDNFTYTIMNTAGETSNPATVSVIVNRPTANDDFATAAGSTPVAIDVVANDTDPDGNDRLVLSSVTVTSPPAHGTYSINTNTGAINYQANAGFFGTDSLAYTIMDVANAVSNPATVTISVTNASAALNDDVIDTDAGNPVTIDVLANDSAAAGLLPNTVVVSSPPAHGTTQVNTTTGQVTYSPAASFSGTDHFFYTVEDGSHVRRGPAQVSVIVNRPTANDDFITTSVGVPAVIDVLSNDTDPDGNDQLNPASVTVTSGPHHGSAAVNPSNGAVTYTPSLTFAGTDTFTYTVSDLSGATSNAAHVTIVMNNPLDDIVGRDQQTGQWFVAQSNGSFGFTSSLWDAWSPGYTWVDVQTGDFNGDGHTDIVGRIQQTGQWFVGLSNGANGFTTSLWGTWSPGVNWTDVKVGDLTGDGMADLIGRDPTTGQWWAAISTGTSFKTSLWDAWSPGYTWVDVQIGDLNGDGKADIIGRIAQNGQWWAGISTGVSLHTTLWGVWSTAVTWVDVKLGDLTGDGKADLIGRVLQNGQWWAGISTGTALQNALWDTWSPGVTWVDVQIGDLNGDGKADIIGRVQQTGQWWVGLSTGASLSTSLWGTWSPNVTWVDVQLGDFNQDGRLDIAGRVQQTGQWWVGLSTGTALTTSLWDGWSPSVTWVDVNHGNFA